MSLPSEYAPYSVCIRLSSLRKAHVGLFYRVAVLRLKKRLLCIIIESVLSLLLLDSGTPICQRLGAHIGRAQASLIFQTLGTCMLLLLYCLDSLPWLIVVFMIR